MIVDGEPLTSSEKKSLGLNPDGFATRIVRIGKSGMLLLTPLKRGDIITAVNNVEESVLSRTALDHVRLKHEPGETVMLDVLRRDKKMCVSIHLKPDGYFSLSVRFARLLEGIGFRVGQKEKSGY
jgi:S1-C subfamily serine protease